MLLKRSYGGLLSNSRFLRLYSTEKEPVRRMIKKKTVSSLDLRKQRNKLAVSSIKDIFESFLPSGNDDEVFDIDPKPIYADPPKFLTLSQPLQQCVQDDLAKQLKKKWASVPIEVKKFHYFLCYSNHGPRESFPGLDSINAPLDLPFKPHAVVNSKPELKTPVHKQAFKLNLGALGPKRAEQARKDSMMDPYSKFVIFLLILITALNFKRDYRVQSNGRVPVNKYEKVISERQQLEEEIAKREEAESQPEPIRSRKWYYLYLK